MSEQAQTPLVERLGEMAGRIASGRSYYEADLQALLAEANLALQKAERETLKKAAGVCDKLYETGVPTLKLVGGPELATARDCASAIRALIPTESPK